MASEVETEVRDHRHDRAFRRGFCWQSYTRVDEENVKWKCVRWRWITWYTILRKWRRWIFWRWGSTRCRAWQLRGWRNWIEWRRISRRRNGWGIRVRIWRWRFAWNRGCQGKEKISSNICILRWVRSPFRWWLRWRKKRKAALQFKRDW